MFQLLGPRLQEGLAEALKSGYWRTPRGWWESASTLIRPVATRFFVQLELRNVAKNQFPYLLTIGQARSCKKKSLTSSTDARDHASDANVWQQG